MSRSGYVDDIDDILQYGRYRGRVASTIRGKNGQAFLRELLAQLDAMPAKELHRYVFNKEGCQCALGVVAAARGVTIPEPEDEHDHVGEEAAQALGITKALADEIMFINDDFVTYTVEGMVDDPAKRWSYVRQWVASEIKEVKP